MLSVLSVLEGHALADAVQSRIICHNLPHSICSMDQNQEPWEGRYRPSRGVEAVGGHAEYGRSRRTKQHRVELGARADAQQVRALEVLHHVAGLRCITSGDAM